MGGLGDDVLLEGGLVEGRGGMGGVEDPDGALGLLL